MSTLLNLGQWLLGALAVCAVLAGLAVAVLAWFLKHPD